jgi:small subunit ribosomal protein S9
MNINQIVAYSIGRRKKAIAQVILLVGNGKFTINKINANSYLQNNLDYLQRINYPLSLLGIQNNFDIHIKAKGGGLMGQTDAIKLAISRALILIDNNNRKVLKTAGLLKRDSRIVERKKYGLKKARKAGQYSKR